MQDVTLSPRIKHDMQVAIKYNTHRKLSKHLAEMKLLKKAISYIKPGSNVLDAPCGTGRAALLLHELGYNATGADLGVAALILARENAEKAAIIIPFDSANIMELPYQNNSFEASLCFRFYHHLENDTLRKQLIVELCRVSRKQVLISYLSPFSFTSIKRKILKPFVHHSVEQHTTTLGSIERFFATQNFILKKNLARKTFIHTLNLAIFEHTKSGKIY